MKTIRLYVCTMLLAAMAVSVTGCSNTGGTGTNPTTGTTSTTTTKAPTTTTAVDKTTEGVIDGLIDDVKKGVDDVKNGAEDVKDDITGTDGTRATTGAKSSTTETTR